MLCALISNRSRILSAHATRTSRTITRVDGTSGLSRQRQNWSLLERNREAAVIRACVKYISSATWSRPATRQSASGTSSLLLGARMSNHKGSPIDGTSASAASLASISLANLDLRIGFRLAPNERRARGLGVQTQDIKPAAVNGPIKVCG